MRTWKHSGFHVYVGPSILQKQDAVRVGLYIVRAPASASRLQLTENGLLKYLAKGSVPNDRCDSLFEPEDQIFDSLEWIAKVTSHIPEKGAQLVHYYGAYSNSHRGKKAKSEASEFASLPHSAGAEESETEWVKLRRKSWAALIQLVYESDPLLCPKCRTQMKIVSVIKDGAVIDKILAHLQYKCCERTIAIEFQRLVGCFSRLRHRFTRREREKGQFGISVGQLEAAVTRYRAEYGTSS